MLNQNATKPKPTFQAPALPTSGYSLQARLKQQQKQKEVLDQIEQEKVKEKQKLVQEQALKERKMAEARLRQIDLDNQRAQQQRIQQKELTEHIRKEVSGIGKGLRQNDAIMVGQQAPLKFLENKNVSDFPIKQYNNNNSKPQQFNSRLRAPIQFQNEHQDIVSQNIDALDLGSSIKKSQNQPYLKQEKRQARVGQMLESLNLHTGMQGLIDAKQRNNQQQISDSDDEEIANYKKELQQSPNMLERSIRQSVNEWKQNLAQDPKKVVPIKKPQEFTKLQTAQDIENQANETEELFEVVKPQFNQINNDQSGYAKIHKNQFVGVKPSAVGKPPPKPQSVISGVESQQSNRNRADSAARAALLKSDILSKEEEARLAREKKNKLDEIKKKYSGRGSKAGSRAGSQASRGSGANSRERVNTNDSKARDTTKCTRDEDLNIEEFMREDMRQINKDEDRIQRELMSLHQKNLGRHAKILTKFRIDTSLKSTEDLLRRMMCLPKQQESKEQRKLHQQKSAVNKRPEDFKVRPDAQDDGQADALLSSIENLDKLLVNLNNGKKEIVLEQLAKKYGLLDDVVIQPSNYAGRVPTPNLRQPTVGQVPLNDPVQKQQKVVQSIQQPAEQLQKQPSIQELQKPQQVILELKEANLMKLQQKYEQPFSIQDQYIKKEYPPAFSNLKNQSEDFNAMEQFSQAPTTKPGPTKPPVSQQKPSGTLIHQSNLQRQPLLDNSPVRMQPQHSSQKLPSPSIKSQIQSKSKKTTLFPPLPGQLPAVQNPNPNSALIEDLIQQQKLLQQNIDNMMQLQREQARMQGLQPELLQQEDAEAQFIQRPQMFHPEPVIQPSPSVSSNVGKAPSRGAWKQEQVKVAPGFNPKLLFDD